MRAITISFSHPEEDFELILSTELVSTQIFTFIPLVKIHKTTTNLIR